MDIMCLELEISLEGGIIVDRIAYKQHCGNLCYADVRYWLKVLEETKAEAALRNAIQVDKKNRRHWLVSDGQKIIMRSQE